MQIGLIKSSSKLVGENAVFSFSDILDVESLCKEADDEYKRLAYLFSNLYT